MGGKLLPFLIAMDLPNCVLEPGGVQRYCYTVTGIGTNADENLSYLILGMDENITAKQIENIYVILNGSAQTVRYNTADANVRWVYGDANTGLSGLRFDFSLNRQSGEMWIGFDVTAPCEVGDVPIALCGSSSVKTGLTIGGPMALLGEEDGDEEDGDEGCAREHCYDREVCEKYVIKEFDLSVPYSIMPYAIPCEPEVACEGELEVCPELKKCEDCRKSIDFTVTQKISVKTPVRFGVKTCCEGLCVGVEDARQELG